MEKKVSLHAIIYGRVQGVYFRDFAVRHARALGLTGYVRNLPQNSVEVYAGGSRSGLEQLLEHLRKGPPGARVERVDVEWGEPRGAYTDFEIQY